MRKRYIDKPSDATEEALVECRRLVEEAEGRVKETQTRLDAYPIEPDTDALLDVQSRFSGIVTDPKLTVNAKAKMLLEAVRIFTHPNGDVTLCWTFASPNSRQVASKLATPSITRATISLLICRCVCQVGVVDRVRLTGVGCGRQAGAPGSVSALPV